MNRTNEEWQALYEHTYAESNRLILSKERMEQEYAKLHESRQVDRNLIIKLEVEIEHWHRWAKYIEEALRKDGIDINKYQVEGK